MAWFGGDQPFFEERLHQEWNNQQIRQVFPVGQQMPGRFGASMAGTGIMLQRNTQMEQLEELQRRMYNEEQQSGQANGRFHAPCTSSMLSMPNSDVHNYDHTRQTMESDRPYGDILKSDIPYGDRMESNIPYKEKMMQYNRDNAERMVHHERFQRSQPSNFEFGFDDKVALKNGHSERNLLRYGHMQSTSSPSSDFVLSNMDVMSNRSWESGKNPYEARQSNQNNPSSRRDFAATDTVAARRPEVSAALGSSSYWAYEDNSQQNTSRTPSREESNDTKFLKYERKRTHSDIEIDTDTSSESGESSSDGDSPLCISNERRAEAAAPVSLSGQKASFRDVESFKYINTGKSVESTSFREVANILGLDTNTFSVKNERRESIPFLGPESKNSREIDGFRSQIKEVFSSQQSQQRSQGTECQDSFWDPIFRKLNNQSCSENRTVSNSDSEHLGSGSKKGGSQSDLEQHLINLLVKSSENSSLLGLPLADSKDIGDVLVDSLLKHILQNVDSSQLAKTFLQHILQKVTQSKQLGLDTQEGGEQSKPIQDQVEASQPSVSTSTMDYPKEETKVNYSYETTPQYDTVVSNTFSHQDVSPMYWPSGNTTISYETNTNVVLNEVKPKHKRRRRRIRKRKIKVTNLIDLHSGYNII